MSEAAAPMAESWREQFASRIRSTDRVRSVALTREDEAILVEPAAWNEAEKILKSLPGAVERLEIAVPEGADRLLNAMLTHLPGSAWRFLQLTFEADAPAGRQFRAHFLAQPLVTSAFRNAYLLRQEATGLTREVFPDQPLRLGRDPSCDIRLTSPQASGEHAVIQFVRRAFLLIDLRSRAGTWLDNRRLQRGVVVDFGRICLGEKSTGHYVEMELQAPAEDAAFLHIIRGAKVGMKIPLLRPCLTMGRGPQCEIQIEAPYISREHLRLYMLPPGLVIRDCGSANGTSLNGRGILGGRLVPGDALELGGEAWTFHSRAGLDGYFAPGWRLRTDDQEASLDRPYTTVGRLPTCEFLVEKNGLSRRHARLVWQQPGRLELHDLASFGGTFVAEALVAAAELQDGARVRFGPYEATVAGPQS